MGGHYIIGDLRLLGMAHGMAWHGMVPRSHVSHIRMHHVPCHHTTPFVLRYGVCTFVLVCTSTIVLVPPYVVNSRLSS